MPEYGRGRRGDRPGPIDGGGTASAPAFRSHRPVYRRAHRPARRLDLDHADQPALGVMRISRRWPALVEPGQIGDGPLSRLPLAFEERAGLGQDQGVRAARAQGLMPDRQLRRADRLLDVLAACLGERPFEYATGAIAEELAERDTQFT